MVAATWMYIDQNVAQTSHRITDAELKSKGTPALPELQALASLLDKCIAHNITIVAHNTAFEASKLNATALTHKLGRLVIYRDQMFCSMEGSKERCLLPQRGSGFKKPSNKEFFNIMFACFPAGRLHRALADCRVTLAAYSRASERGWYRVAALSAANRTKKARLGH